MITYLLSKNYSLDLTLIKNILSVVRDRHPFFTSLYGSYIFEVIFFKYLSMSSNPAALKDLIYERFKPIFFAYDKDNNSTLDPQELRVLLADNLGVN